MTPWVFYLPTSRDPVELAQHPLVTDRFGKRARFARHGPRPLGVVVQTRKNWRVILTQAEPEQGLGGTICETFPSVNKAVEFLASVKSGSRPN